MTRIPLRYLYLDMNSYFASVAQHDEPDLRGRAVGIVTVARPGAACIAASHEAKRAGIGVGTRTAEARALCPGIVFRPARHDRYVELHHAIRAVVERVHPLEGTHSIDEFSCRLRGADRSLMAATALAEAIRASITTRIGPALRCSIGLGSSRLLAKAAAGFHKPAGLDWLTPEVMPEKMHDRPLRSLPGIGRNMEARLHAAGVRDIEALYSLQPRHARRLWNGVDGERFLRALRGEDIPDPVTRPHSLGHSQILSGPNRNPEGARLVARRLLVKAATRLRRGGFLASELSISVKDARGIRAGRTVTMAATQDSFVLLERFAALWRNLPVCAPAHVGVMLGGLAERHAATADLFDHRPSGSPSPREALCAKVDAINQRYGQDTVIYGERPVEIAPFTGAKIAFGRIPAVEEFRD
jgi:DNA polymerase-4